MNQMFIYLNEITKRFSVGYIQSMLQDIAFSSYNWGFKGFMNNTNAKREGQGHII